MKWLTQKSASKKDFTEQTTNERNEKMYTYNFVKDNNIHDMWTYLNRADRDEAFEKAAEYAKAKGYRLYVNTDEVEL